ncbi:hypothetical protein FRB91_009652 [Serendipita sp. 411]|nr:hypothetical protein FRC18_000058 [Serendipita sp. 400]KAG8858591.1 hypothetical protein FRB91_009652 [Serendipita sp. 411]
MSIYRLVSSFFSLYAREDPQQENSTLVNDAGSEAEESSNKVDALDNSTLIPPSIILDSPEDELDPLSTSLLQEFEPPVPASPTLGKKWTRWTRRATKAMSPYQSLQNLKLTLQVVKRNSFSSFDRKGSLTPSEDSPMEGPPISPTFLRHRHLIERIQNQGSKRGKRPVSCDFSSDPATTSSISSPNLSSMWKSENLINTYDGSSNSDYVPIFYGWAAYCGRFQTPHMVSPTHWDDIVQRQRDKRLTVIEQGMGDLESNITTLQSDEAILVANVSHETLDQRYSSWTVVPESIMLRNTETTMPNPS